MRISFLVAIAAAGLTVAVLTAQTRSALGTPLAGITPVEFEEFRLGLEDFLEVEASEEGLGPAFNGTSCAVCHNIPTIGGAGTMAELRAGRRNANGEFETLNASGDTLFHMFSVPGHGCQPVLPADTNVFARRVPIPLFGAGLVEAIPDETLIALEDPFDRNGDGVSGRAGADRRRRKRPTSRRALWVEGAARHAHDVWRRCVPQRDGHHQRSVPAGKRVRCDARTDAVVRSISRSRGHPRSAIAPARDRQFCQLHAFPRARRARRHERPGSRRRADLCGDRLYRPATSRRWRQAPARIRCSIAREWRSFQICSSTTSGPATASSRGPRRRTKSARPLCGGCASGGHSCTTEPRRWKKRSAGTRARPNSREAGSNV